MVPLLHMHIKRAKPLEMYLSISKDTHLLIPDSMMYQLSILVAIEILLVNLC